MGGEFIPQWVTTAGNARGVHKSQCLDVSMSRQTRLSVT